MKALRVALSLVVLGSIIALSGCGPKGGNSEPITDKQLGLLSKTWKLKDPTGGSVTLANVDVTTDGANFTLAITGTKGQTTFSYVCTGRPTRGPWPANGTWSFVTNSSTPGIGPENAILRDPTLSDALNVTYSVDAAGKNLQLSFNYSGSGYTRVSNVSGAWVFNLIPQ